ncbi:30S ribosomal protein S20 [Listeria booriae]|uniref:Small ribosomal subunit protein bS20 n=2 Tax=Listeria TaxID=1637 RepID=A0A099W917_9LIST|nr:30S ribosomal protein S20 [Listeria booriae]KGL41462.1 30S ribosomal protein S20 [Listeria booriae]MBC1211679.1 30S ribosomal protein S20 [Listeria booriae]MBC1226578.1 30S ribosomal protein S20 [Listeria booriae]MBC1230015.1 30S ribosomal protein S20 [Listeria booriae]MBC1233361.1 30S ribosomal protein S20 [Listeria booriae]
MPNIKSAIKRVKTTETRNSRNASQRTAMRTAVKKFEQAAENNADNAKELYVEASKKLDSAVNKGLLHKNNAARNKSRLAKKLAK